MQAHRFGAVPVSSVDQRRGMLIERDLTAQATTRSLDLPTGGICEAMTEGMAYGSLVQGRPWKAVGRARGMARVDVHADDSSGGGNPAKPHSLQDPAAPSRRAAVRQRASPAGGTRSAPTCAGPLVRSRLLATPEAWIGPLPSVAGLSRLPRATVFGRV